MKNLLKNEPRLFMIGRADMRQLLEEMAISDQANSGDLQAWKNDLDKKAVVKLNRIRQNDRRRRVQEDVEKRKKQLLRKTSGKGKGIGKGKQGKKRKADCLDTPLPGPQPPPCIPAIVVPPVFPSAVEPDTFCPMEDTALPETLLPAPEVVPRTLAPPLPVGDWRVLPVKGGWVRFNQTLKRFDSHCNKLDHGQGCKMDRHMKRGVIGLALAWLGCDEVSRQTHEMQKELLSHEISREKRSAGRLDFKRLAEIYDDDYRLALDVEMKERGTNDEPSSIYCRVSSTAAASNG